MNNIKKKTYTEKIKRTLCMLLLKTVSWILLRRVSKSIFISMRCLKQHFGNVDTYRRRSCCRQHRIHQSVDGNRLSFPYQYHGINSLDRNIFLLSYPGFDIRIAGLVPIAKVIFVDCHNPGSFTTGRQCWYSILAVSKRGEYSCCKWVGVNSRFDTISDVMLAFILLSLFAQIRQYRTS